LHRDDNLDHPCSDDLDASTQHGHGLSRSCAHETRGSPREGLWLGVRDHLT
jgi:hypothetical protein